ncbi:RHS repeat-associated core domain-containing protein, partial [Ralstonia pseudosolanacearum]
QDRLTSYLPANSSQSYRYDANGNRTGQTIGGNGYTQTVDPASNRQTASTGPSATRNSYDAVGNLTSDGTTTYSYSDRGRLASVTKNGTITSYLYNGLGQRVVKSGSNVPTGATRYVYDEAGHLLGEYDQSGNAIQETVYLGDTPIATVKNGTAYYVYADQIDTPRVITDTNNLMVWRWDQTDPFGVALPDENPTSLGAFKYNLRFPGQVYDAETGKHYNANRDYDPAGGRYIQSDPIGLNGGQFSTYAYVRGNPLSFIDPLGLYDEEPGLQSVCPECALIPIVRAGRVVSNLWPRKKAPQACTNSDNTPPSTPVGRRGSPLEVADGTNTPTTINGRDYSGHALDRMQGRGVPPSAVEEAIQNGAPEPGNTAGTTVYTDIANGIRVVVNAVGRVITVITRGR